MEGDIKAAFNNCTLARNMPRLGPGHTLAGHDTPLPYGTAYRKEKAGPLLTWLSGSPGTSAQLPCICGALDWAPGTGALWSFPVARHRNTRSSAEKLGSRTARTMQPSCTLSRRVENW